MIPFLNKRYVCMYVCMYVYKCVSMYVQGWMTVGLQCKYIKVYSCIIIYYCIICHTNNCKPTFAHPCICINTIYIYSYLSIYLPIKLWRTYIKLFALSDRIMCRSWSPSSLWLFVVSEVIIVFI